MASDNEIIVRIVVDCAAFTIGFITTILACKLALARSAAAHKCEVAELKHWIKSAARWIKCHDIYHTSGDDLIKQAKEILNDDGEFMFKKGEQ